MKKSITIDDLARLVQDGFHETSEQFQEMRLELRAIRKEVTDVIHRSEFDRLTDRVQELEDMLAMPHKKVA